MHALYLICIYANTFAKVSRISLSRMSSKKRKYDDSYIQFRFTSVVNNGMEKPQCVQCNKVLRNDSMRPAKPKQHLDNVHPQSKHKDKSYFERQSYYHTLMMTVAGIHIRLEQILGLATMCKVCTGQNYNSLA